MSSITNSISTPGVNPAGNTEANAINMTTGQFRGNAVAIVNKTKPIISTSMLSFAQNASNGKELADRTVSILNTSSGTPNTTRLNR